MTSLIILLLCIILLIVAITVFKIHPIPVLLISGLILGLSIGLSVEKVTESLLNGFGNTLKWIGLIILFGTLLGEILSDTGGADIIADSIIKLFGIKRLPLSMAVIGFLVGIPVFVDVAYLTLLPTIMVLSKKSGHSVLVLGLSLAMSLTVAHALIPPTPGPLIVASMLEIKDIGRIIPTNILVAIAAITGGFIWIKWNTKKLTVKITTNKTNILEKKSITGYKKILPFLALLMPIFLMSIGSVFSQGGAVIQFIKNPIWALLIGVAFSLPLIDKKDFSKKLNNFFHSAGSKSATVILITGTGGAFGQVIKDSNIVSSLFSDPTGISTTGILIPFALSFLFTTVTGSITVSLITTASIVAPLITNGTLPPEITAAAIGAGSLGIIHVNSSFFWLFKEAHGFSTSRILKSFSMLSGIVALSGGLMAILLYML
ncbi:GntP family permease [Postechiella marina]|uniref:GntP family permease n=1 Tax=Postechiella marina TaxID=943941 RepID=A0ABP8CER0_9FLAO